MGNMLVTVSFVAVWQFFTLTKKLKSQGSFLSEGGGGGMDS